tara:strand:+ start:2833 stop:3114 length:282 start_codon:yes stop_codon:yes gene_type:complete
VGVSPTGVLPPSHGRLEIAMTRSTGDTVRLSNRDWVGIVAIAITLLGTTLTSYMRHDRILTEIVVRQEYLSAQQEALVQDLERLETRLNEDKQ